MDKKKFMWTGKIPIWRGTGYRRGDVLEFTERESLPYLERGAVVPYSVGKRANDLVIAANEKGEALTWQDALDKVKESEKPAPKKEEVKPDGR